MVLLSFVGLLNAVSIKTTPDTSKKDKSECVTICEAQAPVISKSLKGVYVFIAIVFMLIELFLVYFAVELAMKTKNGPERYVNVILAVTVTIPYLLLKTALKSGNPHAHEMLGRRY